MRCERCGKSAAFGKKVAHDRLYVNGRTNRVIRPNLHTIHVQEASGKRQMTVCTRCMRTMRRG